MKKTTWLIIIAFMVFLLLMKRANGLEYTPREIAKMIKEKYNLNDFHYKLALTLIILESGAYKPDVIFLNQTKTMSKRTIENCKHYNYYNYTYFANVFYGIPNIYFDINYFSLEKFLESLGNIKIGINPKATFIQILKSSNSIEEFANKIKLYKFTEFKTDNDFYLYVKALKNIYSKLA